MALKTGPYSIASVHSFFKKPPALQEKFGTVYRNMFAQMSYFECLLTFILGEMLSKFRQRRVNIFVTLLDI